MNNFIDYCRDGDIESIKKMSLEGRNLNNGFRWACENGHYNVVQYLVELYIHDSTYKPINIHFQYELGFRWACYNGHYIVVRYLMELYKNIHNGNGTYKPIKIYYYDEGGFRWAYYNGHFKVVRYLLKITRNHTYKPFNNYLMAFKKLDKFLL